MSCDLSILKNYLQSLDDYNAEIKNMSHVDYWPKYISIQNQRPKLPENCKDENGKNYDKYTIDELRNFISNEDNKFLDNLKASPIQTNIKDNNPIMRLKEELKTKEEEQKKLAEKKQYYITNNKELPKGLSELLDNVTYTVYKLRDRLEKANTYKGGKRKSKRRKNKKSIKKGKKNRKSNKKSMKKSIKK